MDLRLEYELNRISEGLQCGKSFPGHHFEDGMLYMVLPDTKEVFPIPLYIFIPLVEQVRHEIGGVDPDTWRHKQKSRLKFLLGPGWSHVDGEDRHIAAINVRKRGQLMLTDGTYRFKSDSV